MRTAAVNRARVAVCVAAAALPVCATAAGVAAVPLGGAAGIATALLARFAAALAAPSALCLALPAAALRLAARRLAWAAFALAALRNEGRGAAHAVVQAAEFVENAAFRPKEPQLAALEALATASSHAALEARRFGWFLVANQAAAETPAR